MNAPNFVRRELPPGYTQVEYIQSSGTQYINTGFNPNQNTRLVFDFEALSTAASFYFGARESTSALQYGFCHTAATTVRSDLGAAQVSQTVGTVLQRVVIDKNKTVCRYGGFTLTNTSVTFQCPYPVFLLAMNTKGTAGSLISGRLYACQIYDGDTLVRDFVPAKNSGGTVGLYDMVNGVFYTNAGTGTFTEGPTMQYADRETKKWYLGAGTVMMTNLVPEGSFETMTKWSTWGTSSPDATQAHHGSYSLNLDTAGKFASVAITMPVVGHKYYAREYIKSSGEINPSDCRFEIHGGDGVGLNWVIGWNQGNYPDWTIKSGIVTIDAVNASSYVLRTFALDSTATVWLDNIVLVDLTEAFGAGNEPDQAWCDSHIPYFDGTQPVLCETAPAAARQIKKAYIGDANGVARMFLGGLDVAKMAIGYTGAYTDQPEVTMSGKKYRLLTLTGSGTLTIPEEVAADVWMCNGGNGGQGWGYNGGGGGYVLQKDGVMLSGSVVCAIGAGGSSGATGSTNAAHSGKSTSFGSFAPDPPTTGNAIFKGASGGGQGGSGTSIGVNGAGVSTVPFGETGLFDKHSAGGGGGEYMDDEDGYQYGGGAGGSDGSSGGNYRPAGTSGGGSGGAKGGGNGAIRKQNGGNATFYGSGGGAGSWYVSSSGSRSRMTGGAGYQGVIYVRIPYEQ